MERLLQPLFAVLLMVFPAYFEEPEHSSTETSCPADQSYQWVKVLDKGPWKTSYHFLLFSLRDTVWLFHANPGTGLAVYVASIPCDGIPRSLLYLTFFQAPNTYQPIIYRLRRSPNQLDARVGKWAIVRGSKADPQAIVYQLDYDKPAVSVYLLEGDDNVLFILDQQRNLRVGNENLSYTLNRVVN